VPEDPGETKRKKSVIEYAKKIGHVGDACRRFGIARSTFYLWRGRYREHGDQGLESRRCGPHNHPNKTLDDVAGKSLPLPLNDPMGPIRIVGYLERSHGIKTSGPRCTGSVGVMACGDSPSA